MSVESSRPSSRRGRVHHDQLPPIHPPSKKVRFLYFILFDRNFFKKNQSEIQFLFEINLTAPKSAEGIGSIWRPPRYARGLPRVAFGETACFRTTSSKSYRIFENA